MTYRDIIRTFEIFAQYGNKGLDTEFLWDWAEHDEYGFQWESDEDILIEDLRALRTYGWLLGSDSEYCEEDAIIWDPDTEEGQNATDEQLMEIWNNYKSIYKYT